MAIFLRADFVVKAVILILIASSIFSWALIFEKARLFRRIDQVQNYLKINFGNLSQQKLFTKIFQIKTEDPLTNIFKSAMAELIKTKSKSSTVQSARVERVVEVSTDKQLKNIEKNFTF